MYRDLDDLSNKNSLNPSEMVFKIYIDSQLEHRYLVCLYLRLESEDIDLQVKNLPPPPNQCFCVLAEAKILEAQ